MRECVSLALSNKGARLVTSNRYEEGIDMFIEIVRRFGEATEPELREQVADARGAIEYVRSGDAQKEGS
jgi:hypothetical protein